MKELMESPAVLDSEAQETLLMEVEEVFTEQDNMVLESPPHQGGGAVSSSRLKL